MAPQLTVDVRAPEFELSDFRGRRFALSDFRGRSHVVLVFNRGFF